MIILHDFPKSIKSFDQHYNTIKQKAVYCISTAKSDWDSFETSMGFHTLLLLNPNRMKSSLKHTYKNLCICWRNSTKEMQIIEEESNRIFIEATASKMNSPAKSPYPKSP